MAFPQLDLPCSFNRSQKRCLSVLGHSSSGGLLISPCLWRTVKVRGEGNNQKVLPKQEALVAQVCWKKAAGSTVSLTCLVNARRVNQLLVWGRAVSQRWARKEALHHAEVGLTWYSLYN